MIQYILVGAVSGVITAVAILIWAYAKAKRDTEKYYAKSQEQLKKVLNESYRLGVMNMAEQTKEILAKENRRSINGQEVKGQSD